jgi:hypothetical protein
LFERDAWLARAGEKIAEAVRRRDTRHAIFHGCYDWHSAVHGHWALLRIARVTGEQRFAELATSELTPDRIATEASLLRAEPRFELPYGRAWFLRLAIEHHAVTGDDRLQAMAGEIARSLVAHYEATAPFPASREYDNASWALAQLAAYARHAGDGALAATVQRHVEAHFLDPGRVPDLAVDRARPDFFSPRANWLYLVATTQPAATLARMLDAAALDDRTLAPVEVNGTPHHFGVNWCRAWMLHRLALAAPAELFRRAFDAHVAIGVRDHERAADDYDAYGHWVPQFAVYALTEDAS